MSDPRYRAHAARADVLKEASPEPLASYWTGYRQGMARGDREAQGADEEARDRHVAAALRGDDEGAGLEAYARWCGYHDGRVWPDMTQHRGLLRLAIAVSGLPNQRFAIDVLRIADPNLRQMLSGKRPVPATLHDALQDLAAGM